MIIQQSIRHYLVRVLVLTLIVGCSRSEKAGQAGSKDYNELIAIKMDIQPAAEVLDKLQDLLAKHPSSSEDWRVLSLDSFIKSVRDSAQTEEVKYLEELGWVEGYIIDRKHNDVLLIGREMDSWPGLYADELLLTLDKVCAGSQDPFCSLDPIPEFVKAYNEASERNTYSSGGSMRSMEEYAKSLQQLWGPQKVVVGGVPKESHHSYVMLEADYHMKKMSQGHVSVPPIVSMLDLHRDENTNEKRRKGSQASRFWFNCRKGHPTFIYDEDITMIDQCDVVILTEAQGSTKSGELFDSGERNPEAEYWAELFTKHFREAAVQVEVYAQLENLYRLYGLFKALKYRGHLQEIMDLRGALYEACKYKRVYEIPETYPGLTNYIIEREENQISLNMVSGGVNMNPSVAEGRMQQEPEMEANKNYILRSRTNSSSPSWTVPRRKKGQRAPGESGRPELKSKGLEAPPERSLPLK